MKKFILSLISLLLGLSTNAETLKVEALTPFTTKNPPHIINLKALGDLRISPDVKVFTNDVISVSLIDIKDPKRLKRDATFKFKIHQITTQLGNTVVVEEHNIAKYVPEHKLDKKEIAKTAALSVGNHFVEGLSAGYRAVEGAVKSEEDGFVNRTKSAGKNVYDKSVLSYTQKGKEVVIKEGDVFGIKILPHDQLIEFSKQEQPNYSYEIKN